MFACLITGEAGKAIQYIMAINNPVLGLAKIVQIDGYGRSDVGHFRLIYSTYLAHVWFRAPRRSVPTPRDSSVSDLSSEIAKDVLLQLGAGRPNAARSVPPDTMR